MFDKENLLFTSFFMVFITTSVSLTVIIMQCAKKSKSYYSDEEIQSRMEELRGKYRSEIFHRNFGNARIQFWTVFKPRTLLRIKII